MPKEHHKTKAAKVIGNPDKLIKGITANKEEKKWLTEKITQAGPPHKQWQHTLVLNQLQQLVGKVEQEQGIAFKIEPGDNVIVETPEYDLELPVSLPAELLKKHTDKELLKHLSKGPEHEIAYTAILLQAIGWLTKNISN